MALSGDMLRSHRRKKVEPAAEVPLHLYDRVTLRQYKNCFTAPPPGLKATEFMCVFRNERNHHPGFSRDIMKATLCVGENAWQPKQRNGLTEDEEYIKAVRGMLNKLTPDKYDPVIEAFNLQRVYESDEKINIMVASIFDKALSEPAYSQLYVRLCRDIYSVGEEESRGIFRKRIIGHAQKEFEVTMNQQEEGKLSKRQNTNIKFVCELVSIRVISTRVIHTIVESLLGNKTDWFPDDACIEMLAMIMSTIGKLLDDSPTERDFLNDIISRVQSLLQTANYAPRTRFMLMDILDLKERNWIPRMAKSNVPAEVDQDGNPVSTSPNAPHRQSGGMSSAASQRSKMVAPTVKSYGASFASIVGGCSPGRASGLCNSSAKGSKTVSGGSSAIVGGTSSNTVNEPVLLKGEDRELVLRAVENDPTSIEHLDRSSALLTAQLEFCKSGKREENTLLFVSHDQFNAMERVEAFSSCLTIAIVEDIFSDVPKFQERWALLITHTFDMDTQIQMTIESVAQCIQKVLFCEEEGKSLEDAFPLATCLEMVWVLILKNLAKIPSSVERTLDLLQGLENVFNIPNIPSKVADALMIPLKKSSVLAESAVETWLNHSSISVAGQRIKNYLSTPV